MKNTNIKISLRLMGDIYDVQEITHMLNVYPSETWNKGDLIRNTGKKREYTAWIYNTNTIESLDMDILIKKFQQIFSLKAEKLLELKLKYNLDVSIDFIIIIENKEPPAIYFQPEFIEFVAKIGAKLDIDTYVN